MDDDLRKTWELYTRSWSEIDAKMRHDMFEQCLQPDHTYTDPNIATAGYAELSGYMSEFQKLVPGGTFVTRAFESHHDQCLVHWDMVGADGGVLAKGTSYGRFGADGRLVQMVGFQW